MPLFSVADPHFWQTRFIFDRIWMEKTDPIMGPNFRKTSAQNHVTLPLRSSENFWIEIRKNVNYTGSGFLTPPKSYRTLEFDGTILLSIYQSTIFVSININNFCFIDVAHYSVNWR
jgi:hypothetical protein